MMKHLTPAIAAAALFAVPGLAQESAQNASDGSEQSAQGSEQLAEAAAVLTGSGIQVVMGAAALPIASAAVTLDSAGEVTMGVADVMWEGANAPLVIDDAVIMAGPAPDAAMAGTPADTAATEDADDE